ncbi:C3a anaphylatoxin chemotactic receptor-like [Pristis pectinata]|uniref:C3a anaphylatoxin chemotactic receptor-like n=1 Tax=Pristis pectinata TaxID=685728 RepID=UPI00223DA436|nr:C3a anaphylatoxin chemotactic receptor-like [Pristis pectinata]
MAVTGDRFNPTLGGNLSSSDSTPGNLGFQRPASVILSLIFYTISFLLGVPGNGAVVWVTGFKMKRNVHTVCFLNLAVADLTYCLTLPLQLAGFSVESWRRDHLLQMFLLCAVNINMSSSIFLLTLISISRCLAVTRPIWFLQHLRLAWVRAACYGAWGLAFLTCLPYLLSPQIFPYLGIKISAAFLLTRVVFTFCLPVVIMAACYLLICRELRWDRFAQSRKPVRLIVTVVAAFIVCWLPITVCRLFLAFSQPVPLDLIVIAFAIASFNSALNPLLYVFVGRDFRQVFRRSLAASLRLAFTEERVRVGERPSDPTSWNLGRQTTPDDGEGGRSAASGVSPWCGFTQHSWTDVCSGVLRPAEIILTDEGGSKGSVPRPMSLCLESLQEESKIKY